jgi:glycosyltransferase involved in cell wall biosynthesis
LKILFFQKGQLENDKIMSENVHIAEVLNNLSKLGHTILNANGECYSYVNFTVDKTQLQSTHQLSIWKNIKTFFHNSPFRGEALILFNFFKEIELFILAFKTISIKKPDLIYRRNWLFGSDHILSTIFRIPHITEVNALVSNEIKQGKEGDKLSVWIIDNIERRNFKTADEYIVVTSQIKDTLHNDYKVPENKIVVIENGANTDLFRPLNMSVVKKALTLNFADCYVCFVGGLYIWHGVKYLISAVPEILENCPNMKALIVGEGPMKEFLVQQSKQLGISDKVIFTGRVPYSIVSWYINASDVCVLPGLSGQRVEKMGASPLKLYEYLACGKPVIVSNVAGLNVVEKHNCGIIVNSENPKDLAQAVLKLIRDPTLRQQMGENGIKYVLQNHSWEFVAKRIADVCQNCINQSRKQDKR